MYRVPPWPTPPWLTLFQFQHRKFPVHDQMRLAICMNLCNKESLPNIKATGNHSHSAGHIKLNSYPSLKMEPHRTNNISSAAEKCTSHRKDKQMMMIRLGRIVTTDGCYNCLFDDEFVFKSLSVVHKSPHQCVYEVRNIAVIS